jgi:4-hydroxy-tetrahydrodipicolinate reductase
MTAATTAGSAPVRVALIGMGRMGRAIDALAGERNVEVVARLHAGDMSRGLDTSALAGADVAIEFTVPEHAVDNAAACLALGCPVVVGTTGWSARKSELEDAVRESGCPALWSPNFSVGVQLFLAIVEAAAAAMRGQAGFAAHVVETHHAAKLDAPSGTGIAIGERLAKGLGNDVDISSVRVGSVPGTHEVLFDAPFEQIRLVHEARDRRVFADGALTAARWLAAQKTPALYTMRDVLRASSGEVG